MLYPIGIQSFEEIRNGGYVYVDKTALIYRLTSTGKYYFLSRPRRFGKSLLVSTMEAYFSGRKDLFEGLAMESLEKEWTEYPVLHLDLTGSSYTDISQLKISLDQHLRKWESLYDVTPISEDLSSRFKDIIDAAFHKTGGKRNEHFSWEENAYSKKVGGETFSDYLPTNPEVIKRGCGPRINR